MADDVWRKVDDGPWLHLTRHVAGALSTSFHGEKRWLPVCLCGCIPFTDVQLFIDADDAIDCAIGLLAEGEHGPAD